MSSFAKLRRRKKVICIGDYYMNSKPVWRDLEVRIIEF